MTREITSLLNFTLSTRLGSLHSTVAEKTHNSDMCCMKHLKVSAYLNISIVPAERSASVGEKRSCSEVDDLTREVEGNHNYGKMDDFLSGLTTKIPAMSRPTHSPTSQLPQYSSISQSSATTADVKVLRKLLSSLNRRVPSCQKAPDPHTRERVRRRWA